MDYNEGKKLSASSHKSHVNHYYKSQIKGKESENSYQELNRSRKGQAHTNTRKLNLSTRMNGHRSSSNSPDDLPLPVAIHTRFHHLPFNSFGMYGCSITCPLTLTKSLAAILNFLTNLFYLLDSFLALISDNFPPSIPLATPWWHLS